MRTAIGFFIILALSASSAFATDVSVAQNIAKEELYLAGLENSINARTNRAICERLGEAKVYATLLTNTVGSVNAADSKAYQTAVQMEQTFRETVGFCDLVNAPSPVPSGNKGQLRSLLNLIESQLKTIGDSSN